MRGICRYPTMISVKKRDSQKYRYCKRLCKIDGHSKIVISDYDIWIFARVRVTSTNHKSEKTCDIL